MYSQLESIKNERQIISIYRDEIDDQSTQGFILAYSKNLVLLQLVRDCNLDGLIVYPLADITDMDITTTDIFHTEMLKQDDLFSKIEFDHQYDIQTWESAINSLASRYEIVVAEDERNDSPEFFIGRVEEVNKFSISMLCFGGEGIWDEATVQIPCKSITAFQAGSHYAEAYSRYFDRLKK